MLYIRSFLTIACLLTASYLPAQNLSTQTIQKNLLKSYNRINYWQQQQSDAKDDSLSAANTKFQQLLLSYGKQYPAVMKMSFANFQGLKASTSADGRMRVYSWDMQTGGTMHFYANVVQYRVGYQFKTTAISTNGEGDNGFYCSNVFTAHLNGKEYYIISWVSVGSSKDIVEGVKVFNIDSGRLNTDVRIIKTQTGLHSQLSYGYETSAMNNRNAYPPISFDTKTNTIHLPLIDSRENMTHQFISYKFTGKYFEKVK